MQNEKQKTINNMKHDQEKKIDKLFKIADQIRVIVWQDNNTKLIN